MLSTNSDSFNSSFPTRMPFISFFLFWLIVLNRTANIMLNKSGENGFYCLVPVFRGNVFSFALLRIMLAVGFSYMDFIIWGSFSSIYLQLIECFYNERALNCVKLFFYINWDNYVIFFPFILSMWCITLVNFYTSNRLCIPVIYPTWSQCRILLIGFLLNLFS